jgi:hypothetical protein
MTGVARLESTLGGRGVPINGVRPTCRTLSRRYSRTTETSTVVPVLAGPWSRYSSREANDVTDGTVCLYSDNIGLSAVATGVFARAEITVERCARAPRIIDLFA